jgi:hypothetical protein
MAIGRLFRAVQRGECPTVLLAAAVAQHHVPVGLLPGTGGMA